MKVRISRSCRAIFGSRAPGNCGEVVRFEAANEESARRVLSQAERAAERGLFDVGEMGGDAPR